MKNDEVKIEIQTDQCASKTLRSEFECTICYKVVIDLNAALVAFSLAARSVLASGFQKKRTRAVPVAGKCCSLNKFPRKSNKNWMKFYSRVNFAQVNLSMLVQNPTLEVAMAEKLLV